jgi:hypothetical protein
MINHRAYYKLDVDMTLRAQDKPIILPRSKHAMWAVIEAEFYKGNSVSECVRLINELWGTT